MLVKSAYDFLKYTFSTTSIVFEKFLFVPYVLRLKSYRNLKYSCLRVF